MIRNVQKKGEEEGQKGDTEETKIYSMKNTKTLILQFKRHCGTQLSRLVYTF